MLNLPMAIEPSIIPTEQCNFQLVKLRDLNPKDCFFKNFAIEVNSKTIEANVAYCLGIGHGWCTKYIGGENNYTHCQYPAEGFHHRTGVYKGITLEQLQILWEEALEKCDVVIKYKPLLTELIETQILPLFNTQLQIKHDDLKETTIMTTNQLINIQQQTIGNDTVNAVSARELHKFLESKREFTHWVKPYVSSDNDYGFIECVDFIAVDVGVNRISQQVMKDYWFTMDMAKEVSMLSKTEKGKQARKYFIECEKKVNNPIAALPNFTDPAEAAIAWANQYKEKEKLLLENKQLTKTKSWISTNREASAMGKLARANDKIKWQDEQISQLEAKLSSPKTEYQYATVLAVQSRLKHIKVNGLKLTYYCNRNGLVMKDIPDDRFGMVHSYPAQAWREVYQIDINAVLNKVA